MNFSFFIFKELLRTKDSEGNEFVMNPEVDPEVLLDQ